MGGLHIHNHATSWPNLQMRICKNLSRVEFQVGPSVAINFLGGLGGYATCLALEIQVNQIVQNTLDHVIFVQ